MDLRRQVHISQGALGIPPRARGRGPRLTARARRPSRIASAPPLPCPAALSPRHTASVEAKKILDPTPPALLSLPAFFRSVPARVSRLVPLPASSIEHKKEPRQCRHLTLGQLRAMPAILHAVPGMCRPSRTFRALRRSPSSPRSGVARAASVSWTCPIPCIIAADAERSNSPSS